MYFRRPQNKHNHCFRRTLAAWPLFADFLQKLPRGLPMLPHRHGSPDQLKQWPGHTPESHPPRLGQKLWEKVAAKICHIAIFWYFCTP